MISFVNLAAVLVLAVLLPPATARLTRLIVRDAITSNLRVKLYRRVGEESFLGKLISCHWCTAVWVSILLTTPTWIIIHTLIPQWPLWVKVWMWALTIPAVAYEAARKIDKED